MNPWKHQLSDDKKILPRVLCRKYFWYCFDFRKRKTTRLCGGYLSAQWNCKFRLNPVLQIQSSYVETISFSFCFLGTPPRHRELPTFCDLQFPNCSQGKLDLGTVERRGTSWCGAEQKFHSLCSLPRACGFSCTKTLRASEGKEMGTKSAMKMHINPNARTHTRLSHGMETQMATGSSSQWSIRNKGTFSPLQMHNWCGAPWFLRAS